jgi:hypothetical protein
MLIGYARVSKADGSQVLDLQIDALLAAGVDRQAIYKDRISGRKDQRPGLDACLGALQPGNTLVVWKLDRLGRNMKHMVSTIEDLRDRSIGFRALSGWGRHLGARNGLDGASWAGYSTCRKRARCTISHSRTCRAEGEGASLAQAIAVAAWMGFNPSSAPPTPPAALVVDDAKTLEEVKRLPMNKPSGKYNAFNKITRSAATSHRSVAALLSQPMRRPNRYKGLALAAILASHAITAVCDEIPVASVVAFNTQCARCHEGECSGRMSFELSEDAADEHIRRHGGPLPLETVRDLGELLRYMKERCAFYPMPLALANDRLWERGTLDLLRNVEGAAYFLPIGHLGPGVYRLRMDGLAPGLRICSELVAADFDLVGHEVLTQVGGAQVLHFRVDESAELFLRIRTPFPATLSQVDLATEGPGPSHAD